MSNIITISKKMMTIEFFSKHYKLEAFAMGFEKKVNTLFDKGSSKY